MIRPPDVKRRLQLQGHVFRAPGRGGGAGGGATSSQGQPSSAFSRPSAFGAIPMDQDTPHIRVRTILHINQTQISFFKNMQGPQKPNKKRRVFFEVFWTPNLLFCPLEPFMLFASWSICVFFRSGIFSFFFFSFSLFLAVKRCGKTLENMFAYVVWLPPLSGYLRSPNLLGCGVGDSRATCYVPEAKSAI
jgi:hypothetical protein